MTIAIIEYNAGNVYSVQHALQRLGAETIVTADVQRICSADKVIFPGVGEAAHTMHYLRQTGLDEVIRSLRQPVLGICLGMQLLCRHSEEGQVDCLGIFDVPVRKFQPRVATEKIPHMGWNTLSHTQSPLFKDFTDEAYVYFVHSYYVPVCPYTAAQTDYITPFSAALHQDNFYATQFHPEKSGSVGERILYNFLTL